MLLRELTINERSFGPDHPNVARNLSSLAQLYSSKGDVANALQTLQRIAAVQEKNLPLNLAAGSERQKLAYFGPFGSTLEKIISFQVSRGPIKRRGARPRHDSGSCSAKDESSTRWPTIWAPCGTGSERRTSSCSTGLAASRLSLPRWLLNGPQRIPLGRVSATDQNPARSNGKRSKTT